MSLVPAPMVHSLRCWWDSRTAPCSNWAVRGTCSHC